jgi:hypothetical protein
MVDGSLVTARSERRALAPCTDEGAALDAFADRAADGARIVLVADVVAASVPLPLASPAILATDVRPDGSLDA